MQEYKKLVETVLFDGLRKPSRPGVETLSVFNYNYEVDLTFFPLLTTKPMSWKNILIENLWFLQGRNDLAYLHRHGIHFWDAWAAKDGTATASYGPRWVYPVDQIDHVLKLLKKSPHSRRAVVTAWDPVPDDTNPLPPCHFAFVLNAQGPCLNLHLSQRSGDVGLGIPYNLAGYAFLTQLFAHLLRRIPGRFAHSIVDAHIYYAPEDSPMAEYDHSRALETQIKRAPRPLPKLKISDTIRTLADVREAARESTTEGLLSLFRLEGYDPHTGPIKLKPAV